MSKTNIQVPPKQYENKSIKLFYPDGTTEEFVVGKDGVDGIGTGSNPMGIPLVNITKNKESILISIPNVPYRVESKEKVVLEIPKHA